MFGDWIDFKLLDNLIIGDDYTSLKEKGIV